MLGSAMGNALCEEPGDAMSLDLIGRLSAGENLTEPDMADAIDRIMRGEWSESQIALLLTGLHHKGETVEELAGAARALRAHMTPIRSTHPHLIDTCGTGGDGSGTFNISTAAALVAAAAGVPVAKHGNRSITSKTGSADVLAALGVNIAANLEQVEACLAEVGICFCFAPLLHPSMKHVAAVRQKLGFRTIFNLLGPLCNPANADYQLLGVGKPELRPLMAKTLQHLGTHRAVVVCGEDGLDEVSLRGPTRCSLTTASAVRDFTWVPSDFGITSQIDLSSLEVDGPAASAEVIRHVLQGAPGPALDIVVLNAAAALWTAERGSPLECATAAREAIMSGAAAEILQGLIGVSHA
jgi:anthranilate phosphoribosyltransferase